MGKVVEKKKKKKGRPSLLDLQKRNIREQQEQEQQLQLLQKKKQSSNKDGSNYKIATGTPVRRSTRRNPNPSPEMGSAEEEEDDEEGNRREKELKLVLKLQKSSGNLNSNASDSDENGGGNHKKRKINAIGGGSGSVDYEKGEKSISVTNPTNNNQVAQLESGPSTPLPDKKLLLFILDRLQKKDTYGVFSEPVDLEELPDYHEVIQHPMDFGTVRKKLNNGAYANLEHFEKDIFLICSNAMQYNAPDTVYFRQARSIQEMAKRNFENLRHDSNDNEPETKAVRRGRPPTKNFKKPLGRPSLERAHSEFSSDATLATGTENATWNNLDLRKSTLHLEKFGIVESSGQFYSSRNDVNAELLSENKFDRDEVLMSKGYSMKHGKKQVVLDENRRNAYVQFHRSGREPSVLTTFDAERKQLMTVGLPSEHGYTRSLARFAANLGPVAWKVAAKRIERCLPTGVNYGPGWVGENDVPQRLISLSSSTVGLPSSSQPFLIPQNLSSTTSHSTVKVKGDKLTDISERDDSSEKPRPSTNTPLDGHLRKPDPTSHFVTNRSSEPCTEKAEVVEGFNKLSSSMGAINTRPPFSIHQSYVIRPGMNGFNRTYGFNMPAQMGKRIGAGRSAGFSFQSSQMLDRVSRTNANSEDLKLADNTNTINPGRPLPNSEHEASAASLSEKNQSTWQGLDAHRKTDSGLSPQQKHDAVLPYLNVRFHSPGSPSSSRVDSTQPDLALQL